MQVEIGNRVYNSLEKWLEISHSHESISQKNFNENFMDNAGKPPKMGILARVPGLSFNPAWKGHHFCGGPVDAN